MYQLIIDKKVSKFIDTLDKPTRKCILNALFELKESPYAASNIKKLQGADNYYRKRVGNYHIVFTIKNDQLIATVLKIDSRGDVHKK